MITELSIAVVTTLIVSALVYLARRGRDPIFRWGRTRQLAAVMTEGGVTRLTLSRDDYHR